MQTLQQIYDGTIEIPCLFNISLSYQDERFFNKTINNHIICFTFMRNVLTANLKAILFKT